MAGLLYREDMDEVRQRLTRWWNGEDIGRPVLLLYSLREKPLEDIPAMPEPAGWVTSYSTRDFAYRVNSAARACINNYYLGEAAPNVAPHVAPGALSLYLGCKGVEMPGTVWLEPCIESPETARFEIDEDNGYWQFTLRLGREMLRLGDGKFLVEPSDLIEGLDTLAGMRGNEQLLVDMLERPDWVHQSLRQITELYFHYYDIQYDMFRDETGGSSFWMWAPGRMCKLQCDFSAMISAEMFGEFMGPVLREMTGRLTHCMYHWDGPGALKHHDVLLSLPNLDMLQWTPGAGVEGVMHKRWWPYYHKTVDAGKKLVLMESGPGARSGFDEFKALKREFGPRLRQFAISLGMESRSHTDELIRMAYE